MHFGVLANALCTQARLLGPWALLAQLLGLPPQPLRVGHEEWRPSGRVGHTGTPVAPGLWKSVQ